MVVFGIREHAYFMQNRIIDFLALRDTNSDRLSSFLKYHRKGHLSTAFITEKGMGIFPILLTMVAGELNGR